MPPTSRPRPGPNWPESDAAQEYDLWVASQTDAGPFLHRYWEAGGAVDLDVDRFEFYCLRRYVEDMAARLFIVQDERAADDEVADALDGIERFGFALWRHLENRVAEFRSAPLPFLTEVPASTT